jgi:hypothetical protein
MLVVRASIRPKFDSSRDPRLLFGQPLAKCHNLASYTIEPVRRQMDIPLIAIEAFVRELYPPS